MELQHSRLFDALLDDPNAEEQLQRLIAGEDVSEITFKLQDGTEVVAKFSRVTPSTLEGKSSPPLRGAKAPSP